MNKRSILTLSVAIILVVGLCSAFQYGIDNSSAGASGHLDLPANGTCVAGPSTPTTVRLCGNNGALQVSLSGGAPFTLVNSSGTGFIDYAQLAPDTLQVVTGTLTNSQVLGMYATPVTLVAAPGAGAYNEVVSCILENLNGGTAYTGGGAIGLYYTNVSGTVGSTTAAATFLTSPTVSQMILLTPSIASAASSTILNTALVITNGSAAFATGTGTIKYQLTYRVRTGL